MSVISLNQGLKYDFHDSKLALFLNASPTINSFRNKIKIEQNNMNLR